MEFQSTPPVKAATPNSRCCFTSLIFQSTPPVKAATLLVCIVTDALAISIHAAREGGDRRGMDAAGMTKISIHAAREGGDPVGAVPPHQPVDFNPRRP